MRKNKTWNLNLFDEDVLRSVEQIENAVFYTSDTEAFLNFIPQDSGFEFDSATIALFNNDDQSLISTSMVVVDGMAQYEMPSNVIAHFGKWSVQVIFTKGLENYTSRLLNFEVERYLTDSRPPKLEEVENIAKLVNEANEIIDELKNAMNQVDFDVYDNHIADSKIHVTQANKNTWNSKQNALTTKEKEDFKRYTIVDDGGTDKTVSLAVVNGQPVLRTEE